MKAMTVKKLFAVLLSFVMVISAVPFMASGAEIECYIDGEPSTSLYAATQNITGTHTIVIAEGISSWPDYLEPEAMKDSTANKNDVLTIDLNGQTINACVDIWPYGYCYGTIIIKNGTIIAPEDCAAIHVCDTVKAVKLYDVEVYGQLDSNKFKKTGENALQIYSGTFHEGNFSNFYSSMKPNWITVYGGNWDYDVSSFLAKGLELVELTDGTYSVETAGEVVFEEDADGAYLINNVEDLQKLRRAVDSGTTFKGKSFKMTADIDLSAINWNPIGTNNVAFEGNLDGQGHTISNLYIKRNENYIGLFSSVSNSEIKNLVLLNPTVLGDSKSEGAAALIGQGGKNSKITDVSITGKIAIETGTYTGGICGYNSSAEYRNCIVDGTNSENFVSHIECLRSLDSNGNGLTNYTGGICGHCIPGSAGIIDSKVMNIELIANGYGLGGIVGVLQSNTFIKGCAVENVVFRAPQDDAFEWTGYIAGKDYSSSTANLTTITDCTASYTAHLGSDTESSVLYPVGRDESTTNPGQNPYNRNSFVSEEIELDEGGKVVKGKFAIAGEKAMNHALSLLADGVELVYCDDGWYRTSINGAAKIGIIGYKTVQDAVDSAKSGDVIVMTSDATEEVLIPEGLNITIDANAFTFSGKITNNGKVILSDSTNEGGFENTTFINNGTVSLESGKYTKSGTGDSSYNKYLPACTVIGSDGYITKEHTKHIVEGTAVAATCISDGYEGDIFCDCGEINGNGEVIKAAGAHSYGEYVYNGDADCSHDGTKTAVCTLCGDKHTIAAEGTKYPHSDKNSDDVCDECDSTLPGYFRCKWCPRYEAKKDNPVYGWLISFIHAFVHLMSRIKVLS